MRLTPLWRTAAALLALKIMAASAATETVNLAWSPTPLMLMPQVEIAMAKGYFSDAGIKVQRINFPSGREAFEALLGGQVDVATLTEFPAITGALRQQPFGIVADVARYRGTRVISSAKYTPLRTVSDLAGMKIGTPLGTNTDYYLSQLLAAAKVSAERVNVAPVDLIPALIRGDIQAIVPFAGVENVARKALGEDYRELKSESYQSHFLLAASQTVLNDKPAVVNGLLTALLRADADLKRDPAGAMTLVTQSMHGTLPQSALETM
ncbi:ABC transporter substrate-binding protein [Candidatus Sodalis endolongispinus]|uniref:ABC transporter substrate-binding protein n=1 Tax=Candidatus Sodalis endolongispinus TaxID=2812662 RepID=A0ABS5Y8S5_9GAMM|nr:ABC transporter substrate-binding protein [Candidatus Sodalis endolongispinus]MBT9431132.1 ABC transporter substrate-binding protein [Candidatus Sodalis endolongispinus]